MVSEAIIVALITGICAIIGNLLISRQSSRDLYNRLDKQSDLADQRIKGEIDVIKEQITNLKASVDKHNQVIERTANLEKSSAVHGQELESINHEIRDIKQSIHDIRSGS